MHFVLFLILLGYACGASTAVFFLS